LDLRRQLAIVRSRLLLIIVGVLVAGLMGYVGSGLQATIYEARATLIVGQSLTGVNPGYDQLLASQRLSATYATVATTRPIVQSAIEQLGLSVTADQLIGSVQAAATPDSALLTITARDGDPARAAALANAIADRLVAASPSIQGREAGVQQSIDRDLKAAQDQLVSIQAEVDHLGALASRTPEQATALETLRGQLLSLRSFYGSLLPFWSGSASNLLTFVQPAVAPSSPIAPRPLFNTLLAAAVGLLVVLALVFVVEYLDDTFRSADDVQDGIQLPTLAVVERMKTRKRSAEAGWLAALLSPHSRVAEAFRTLRSNVEFSAVDAPIHTLLVTSSIPGEGKTITAANLAVVFAQSGRRVLLVDADLRKPGAHLVFKLPNEQGLTTLIRGEQASRDVIAHPTGRDNLMVLTSGPVPPNPAELLGSQRMRMVLQELRTQCDLLILDSAPLQVASDSAILSSFVDGTVFVVNYGRTRRGAARQAREVLAKANAHVLGAVLNCIPRRGYTDGGLYYGGAYGSAGGGDEGSEPNGPFPAAPSSGPQAAADRMVSRPGQRASSPANGAKSPGPRTINGSK
jgi:capsular exopolysaccharide synthesis family protein